MIFRLEVENADKAKALARANDVMPESHWRKENQNLVMQFRSAENMGTLIDALAVRQIGFEIIASN